MTERERLGIELRSAHPMTDGYFTSWTWEEVADFILSREAAQVGVKQLLIEERDRLRALLGPKYDPTLLSDAQKRETDFPTRESFT